ncbi:hypothetical protein D7I43_31080 [Micromonospora globbae]|uniref:TolB-like translocation protein n=1 Tax=Micromonospora globbae TaxID=1894969 RepID=A0A420EQA8_9ACTN|nr:hypothetical protein D7I43_31080 [Micromonospora globbae]
MSRPVSSPRRSLLTLVIATALVGAAVGALLLSIARGGGATAASDVDADLFRSPHIVFRSLAPGADHGRIGYVAAGAPDAPRKLAGPRCVRVAAAGEKAVCLRTGNNPVQPYEVVRLDRGLREVNDEPLSGVPSRARVAPDGRHFATTVFVNGHNYISLGFSTETIVYDADGRTIGNLEDFTFTVNGRIDNSVDRNVWGVTFTADSRLFFATVAASGRTYLARGDLDARTLTALQDNAECPSLSPDERTIIYKKRVSPTADQAWRFHALDLTTGRERPLAETRSIDDQVAWLDDEHILYAVPNVAGGRTSADIWTVPLDGGPPRLLIPDADSPTVVGSR